MYNLRYANKFTFIAIVLPLLVGCKKLLEIKPPKSTITTEQVFSSNAHAEWALNGVYQKLTHATDIIGSDAIGNNFGSGLVTLLGGLSADEMYNLNGTASQDYLAVSTNKLSLQNSKRTLNLWKSAYKTVYDANAVIEGIAGSEPGVLVDSLKVQFTAEALTLRAFVYFYLVNFFGDVPLVLTVDYNEIIAMERTPKARVYEQIITDLKAARTVLLEDFTAGKGERVRVHKWLAEALLARVYLYTGRYSDAISSATTVLNKSDLFKLENMLEDVFKKNSKEAIFQLKPNNTDLGTRSATPEGAGLNPPTSAISVFPYPFYPHFVSSFEPADKRKMAWMSTSGGVTGPSKYKQALYNSPSGAALLEYYVVMRVAELYLIRAEAKLLLSEANKDAAIEDLNALRPRAGLTNLPNTLTPTEVMEAIAQERKFELFAEWGHRWLDLKRTGKAEDVLTVIENKKPWLGSYQLLYPIPVFEIENNRFIKQNPEYDRQ